MENPRFFGPVVHIVHRKTVVCPGIVEKEAIRIGRIEDNRIRCGSPRAHRDGSGIHLFLPKNGADNLSNMVIADSGQKIGIKAQTLQGNPCIGYGAPRGEGHTFRLDHLTRPQGV